VCVCRTHTVSRRCRSSSPRQHALRRQLQGACDSEERRRPAPSPAAETGRCLLGSGRGWAQQAPHP
jgi:hypothetical protein